MSNLNSIINVSISRNTTQPSQTGFGTPIILSADPELNPEAGKEWGAERVRTYTSLDSVSGATGDFATSTNVHAMAGALFAQNPAPPQIKIGRLSTSLVAQTVSFVVDASPIEFAPVGFTINGTEYYHTVTNGQTATAVATAIAALPEVEAVTFSDATGTVTILADTAGERFRFGAPKGGVLTDNTSITASNLTTDYDLIAAEDNDFYCCLLDATSASEIEALSDHIQLNGSTNPKIFIARTFDDDVKTDPDTTSIAYTLNNSTNDRTLICFTETGEYLDCAIAGRHLPEEAGSVNWAWNTLLGTAADTTLTDSVQTLLEAKYVTVYTPLAGINLTRYGAVAGGEWIDNIRGSDWTGARIRERVTALLANADKVPFTDPGIQSIRAEILAQMATGVSRGFLAATPEPTCTVPLAADVAAADKQARHLSGVTFRAELAGAVNKTTLVGELDL